jgi:hypothetical protein
MLQKLKTILLSAALLGAAVAPMAVPATASAADAFNGQVTKGVCQGSNLKFSISNSGGGQCTSVSQDTVNNKVNHIITLVINIFSVIVGIVAVIMIIVGGFKYITSGGESGKIGGAKNTIIYAIIGLIIVALAQFIVHFVLGNVLGAGGSGV